jgi:penicillin-binding protein 1B
MASILNKRLHRRWPWFRLLAVMLVLSAMILIYLDAWIQHRFEGHRWSLPAKVYSRPLELFSGQHIALEQVLFELEQLGYRRVSQVNRTGQMRVRNHQIEVFTRGFRFADGNQLGDKITLQFSPSKLLWLKGSANQPLSVLRLEPKRIGGIYPSHQQERELIQLHDLPNGFIETLVETEDRNYFNHHGLSLTGIGRALWANIRAGKVVQGGSTLTQQLVKNFYLTQTQSWWRKLQEVPMALLLDFHYDKDEILEVYLNEVFLGQSGQQAIHGFGLGSQFYFDQPVHELKLHQIALLVGLIKGPSYYNPRYHPQRAKQRRDLVLNLLASRGVITAQQSERSKAYPLEVVPMHSLNLGHYPAYMDLVKAQLQRDYRSRDLSTQGLQIFTNLDPWVQHQAETSLAKVAAQLEADYADLTPLQGAVVVSHRDSGELLAVVGDRNSRYAGFNRALYSRRNVGSLIKPVIHLAALSQPQNYNLVSLVDDSPLSVKLANDSDWYPENYDQRSHGQIPLYKSLVYSYNIANVRLGMAVGVQQVLNTLGNLGVAVDLQPYPSILLGAIPMSPLDVTRVYQTIAAEGFNNRLQPIRYITRVDGQLLEQYHYKVKQVAGSQATYLLQHALQRVTREGTAQNIYRYLPKQQTVAGKTGTTNDQRDSWFAGFTGDYVATVWMGRDDAAPTQLTGSSGALKVWGQMMSRLLLPEYGVNIPSGITYLNIHPDTGQVLAQDCATGVKLPFVERFAPQKSATTCD